MTEDLAPEGFYSGEIKEAWLECLEDDDESLRMCFTVALENGRSVDCRHKTFGERAEKARAIAEKLGLSWPNGLEEIAAKAPGQRVRVNVRHNSAANGKVYVNGYIVLGGGKKADPEQVKAALAKLAGQPQGPHPDDDLPF